jgi:hypothetical protein
MKTVSSTSRDQPVRNVHIGKGHHSMPRSSVALTETRCHTRLHDRLGERTPPRRSRKPPAEESDICEVSFASKLDYLPDLSSVWRPLIGPLEDWPLCLCDSATINTKDDLIPADHVAREENGLEGRIVENYAVHYNQQQRWYFLSDQQSTEILVFRQSDTSGKPGRILYLQ